MIKAQKSSPSRSEVYYFDMYLGYFYTVILNLIVYFINNLALSAKTVVSLHSVSCYVIVTHAALFSTSGARKESSIEHSA